IGNGFRPGDDEKERENKAGAQAPTTDNADDQESGEGVGDDLSSGSESQPAPLVIDGNEVRYHLDQLLAECASPFGGEIAADRLELKIDTPSITDKNATIFATRDAED